MRRSSVSRASALSLAVLSGITLSALTLGRAEAVSLDEACSRWASKLKEAQASGDSAKAQKVFTEGNKRIQSRFGTTASCPNVKAPT